jgi:hypothetical protein
MKSFINKNFPRVQPAGWHPPEILFLFSRDPQKTNLFKDAIFQSVINIMQDRGQTSQPFILRPVSH